MKDEQKLIDKYDNLVRGTSVNFFLTEAGKQKYQLTILPPLQIHKQMKRDLKESISYCFCL